MHDALPTRPATVTRTSTMHGGVTCACSRSVGRLRRGNRTASRPTHRERKLSQRMSLDHLPSAPTPSPCRPTLRFSILPSLSPRPQLLRSTVRFTCQQGYRESVFTESTLRCSSPTSQMRSSCGGRSLRSQAAMLTKQARAFGLGTDQARMPRPFSLQRLCTCSRQPTAGSTTTRSTGGAPSWTWTFQTESFLRTIEL